jgi:vancomycin resistance protein VanJ
LQWIVAPVLAFALALSCASLLGNQRIWWLELTRYVPYPIYLAGALGALGLSLFLGRLWRLAALLALALVLTVIMGLALGRGDDGSQRLRMMTYNVKAYLASTHEDGYSRIAWEVIQADPDILVMQDANHLVKPDGAMPTAIRTMLGSREVFAFGQYVIASRYPLRGCKPGDIAFRGHAHSYLQCTVRVAGVDVDVVTAHFLSPREGLNATRQRGGLEDWEQNFADRLTQADKLATNLAASRRPLIAAGDLNAVELSPIVRTLLDIGLRDAFSSAGFGYGYTHGHALRPGFSFLRIDHILVSPTIGVRDCFVGGKDGSEHRPVIADLWMARE